jgi:quercetin dioxygenase-like cupin family protein
LTGLERLPYSHPTTCRTKRRIIVEAHLPVRIGPDDGETAHIYGVGIRFLLRGAHTGGGLALVEAPIAPRALAAEAHTHTREDEWSFVLEGEVGFLLGETELVARAGDLVPKPRNLRHAFWNAGDAPARVLEIITPAGFEEFFDQAAVVATENPDPEDEAAFPRWQRLFDAYGVDWEPETIAELAERHGLATE